MTITNASGDNSSAVEDRTGGRPPTIVKHLRIGRSMRCRVQPRGGHRLRGDGDENPGGEHHGIDLLGGVRVADPTRVAAQIVSGIGFLGAGVILRDGLNVRGLNTAATLWCAAAVGALAGAGMHPIALLGTVAVIIANLVLRPLGRRIDRQPTGGDEVTIGYRFEAVCAEAAEAAEAHIRALLVQAISGTTFQLRGIRSFNTDTDHQVSVVAELTAEQRNDSQLEQAVSRLSLEPAVTWTVATDLDNVTDYPHIRSTIGATRFRYPIMLTVRV